MKKKAIFGGTFDPIHNGHLNIAYEALYSLNLDNVIFVPSGNPPHKDVSDITDAKSRLEMVKLAVKDEKKFAVSDYEINKAKPNYTYETLKVFNDMEKDTEWYFLTGADCLIKIDTWKNVSDIFKLCKFVVFNRPGYNLKELISKKEETERKYSGKIIFLDLKLLDISSTYIRNMVKKGRNVSYLMPKDVYDFIKDKKLYV